MDINMDISLAQIDSENVHLSDSLRDLETENNDLLQRVNALEKTLNNEKKLHQLFVNDVAESEATQLEDFQREKRAIVEENKSLVKENSQLKKDKDFYKYAHEESANKGKTTVAQCKTTLQLTQETATASPPKSTRQSFSQTMVVRLENVDVGTETIQLGNLSDSLNDLEAQKDYLVERVSVLEKTLDKERKFHRKYSEDTAASEATRYQDFKNEKRVIVEENKSLVKQNRQLKKDSDFYKNEHEKLAKVSKPTVSSSKATRRSASQASTPNECTCIHKSSKVLSTVNKNLFEENKKLKLKISNLIAANAILKKKNKQLENFRSKVDNKKTNFCKDSEELERLVSSTLTKNKHTFNPEALAMLGRLP